MKIAPVKFYKTPAYPTRELFIWQPNLLKQYAPASWKGKELVAKALAVFTLGSSLGPVPGHADQCQLQEEIIGKDGKVDDRISSEAKEQRAVVAPIFEHGEGRGATGCIVIAPPVFLSEEEARQVIEEELKTLKLNFTEHDMPIEDIRLRKEHITMNRTPDGEFIPETETAGDTAFVLDRFDPKRNIGYEYVSSGDQVKFSDGGWMSTVHSYYPRDVADSLRQKLQDYGKIRCSIFYDPLLSFRLTKERFDNLEEAHKKDIEQAKELLRSQVRDFVDWIKKENILNNTK